MTLTLIKKYMQNQIHYHIDATLGNDSNDGLSISTPWKSLKNINNNPNFIANSKILLKKGEVWYNQSLNIKSSGKHNEPILISSYGLGNKNPIISSVSIIEESISADQWDYIGNYTWRTKIEVNNPGRLFKNYEAFNDDSIKELVKAYDINNLGKKTFSIKDKNESLAIDSWFWTGDASNTQGLFKKLYIFNGSDKVNPSEQTKEELIYKSTNTKNSYRHINIFDQKNIIINNIEFHGGVQCIHIGQSKHIMLKECSIGKYSTTGVDLDNVRFIVLNDNDLNTLYKVNFGLSIDTINKLRNKSNSLTNTGSRGNGDGIKITNDGSQCAIFNNSFINWSHSAISMISKSPKNEGIHSNKIYNNKISAKEIAYSRGFTIAGVFKGVYNNEIFNNEISFTSIQSQIAGQFNNFHHNKISNVSQSHIRNPGMANGIIIANNKEKYVAEYNCFDNNIIKKCDDAGINVNNWGSEKNFRNPVRYNKFRNNTIVNCGIQVNGINDFIGLSIVDGSRGSRPKVEFNEYSRNQISHPTLNNKKIDKVILYHGITHNVYTFNQSSLLHKDIAIDNIDNQQSII